MESALNEIEYNILAGNYSQAHKIAKEWNASLKLHNKEAKEYSQAKEAFIYTHFFFNRLDRIHSLKKSSEKYKVFLKYLKDFENLPEKLDFKPSLKLYHTIYLFLHSQIATELSQQLSNQKFYNLKDEEIYQFIDSLLIIENYQEAKEVLNFLYQMNSESAKVNFLLGYIYILESKKEQADPLIRKALYLKPKVLISYIDFLKKIALDAYWLSLHDAKETIEINCKKFALFLEVNHFYSYIEPLNSSQLDILKKKIMSFYYNYKNNTDYAYTLKISLLHYIIYYIEQCIYKNLKDEVQEYKNMLREVDELLFKNYFHHKDSI